MATTSKPTAPTVAPVDRKTADRKPAKKAAKEVTYRMRNAGVTEGKSGTVHAHEMRILTNKLGEKSKAFFCTVEEGEFDHLFQKDADGKLTDNSKYILGKA